MDEGRAQHAMENPDGAALLANAKRAIDGLVNNKIIKAGTGKNWKDQIDDQFTSTGDITDLIKSFGFSLERLWGAGGGLAEGGADGRSCDAESSVFPAGGTREAGGVSRYGRAPSRYDRGSPFLKQDLPCYRRGAKEAPDVREGAGSGFEEPPEGEAGAGGGGGGAGRGGGGR